MCRGKLPKEKVPVLPHSGLRLALRESQIEAGRGSAAHPAAAGTKGMDQPGIAGEKRVFNPCQPAPRDEMWSRAPQESNIAYAGRFPESCRRGCFN